MGYIEGNFYQFASSFHIAATRKFKVVNVIKKLEKDYRAVYILHDYINNCYDVFKHEGYIRDASSIFARTIIAEKMRVGNIIERSEDVGYISFSMSVGYSSTFRGCIPSQNVRIHMKNDGLFKNIYEDNEKYKIFPDIGERTKDNILCSYEEQDYYAKGRLVDIIIAPPSRYIRQIPENEQLIKYSDMLISYYRNIKDVIKPIFNDENASMTKSLVDLYNRVSGYINLYDSTNSYTKLSTLEMYVVDDERPYPY